MINESTRRLTAYVSVASAGRKRLLVSDVRLDAAAVGEFAVEEKDTAAAMESLRSRDFVVRRVGDMLRIEGDARTFKKSFGTEFIRSDEYVKEYHLEGPQDASVVAPMELFMPSPATEANLLDVPEASIDGVVFPQPLALHAAPAVDPPSPLYPHLKPEDEVLEALNVGPVHMAGIDGSGVRAAMIDSGFHWAHPYFRQRGYQTRVAIQPQHVWQDPNGHGTGESANLLAVAPGVELFGLAMDDILESFEMARALGVQIVSNSWGSAWPTDGPNGYWNPYWRLVEREIALCAAQGMIVMFSGGNGGRSFTASHPDTISIGGVHATRKASGGFDLEASDYASSFDSTRYPGQHVPDVCGLVGMQPRAIYITLPVPPDCELDRSLFNGGVAHPDGDQTASDDGWAVFSGTSAACPQAAGVVALMLARHGTLSRADVLARLQRAQDVTTGVSAMGDPAGPGPDAATGHGLIDADAACA